MGPVTLGVETVDVAPHLVGARKQVALVVPVGGGAKEASGLADVALNLGFLGRGEQLANFRHEISVMRSQRQCTRCVKRA